MVHGRVQYFSDFDAVFDAVGINQLNDTIPLLWHGLSSGKRNWRYRGNGTTFYFRFYKSQNSLMVICVRTSFLLMYYLRAIFSYETAMEPIWRL